MDEDKKFSHMKGEEYKKYLDNAYEQLKSENGSFELCELQLKMFINQIPDDTPVAESLTKRLQNLDKHYLKTKKAIEGVENSGKYLEMVDALTEKRNVEFIYLMNKYYICHNIYEKFKLYEDSSIVEYEL